MMMIMEVFFGLLISIDPEIFGQWREAEYEGKMQ